MCSTQYFTVFIFIGHIEEAQSLFTYFDEETYSYYNDGWDTHVPTFQPMFNDAQTLDEAQAICGEDDLQCVFDYAVTNDISFAAGTHMVTMNNQETQIILSELTYHCNITYEETHYTNVYSAVNIHDLSGHVKVCQEAIHRNEYFYSLETRHTNRYNSEL